MEMEQIPPLFQEYPELAESIAWKEIGCLPSPVQKLNGLNYPDLWIKRDDLDCPLYGGNKIRKLEFTLAHAIKLNKSQIVTVGALGSNHCLATAILAKKFGLKCSLILFYQPVNARVRKQLLLFKHYGADIHYAGSMQNLAFHFYFLKRFQYPSAYFLAPGGSSVRGTLGFVNAAFELKRQIESGEMPLPERIYIGLGSNGSMAGLILGLKFAGLDIPVYGVRVTRSHLGFVPLVGERGVRALAFSVYKYLKLLKKDIPEIGEIEPRVIHDFLGYDYGYKTDKGSAAAQLMKETNGIELDPVYTAKTFAAVLECIKNNAGNSSAKKGPILYWHTYNCVNLDSEISGKDFHELPAVFHRFFTEERDGSLDPSKFRPPPLR